MQSSIKELNIRVANAGADGKRNSFILLRTRKVMIDRAEPGPLDHPRWAWHVKNTPSIHVYANLRCHGTQDPTSISDPEIS